MTLIILIGLWIKKDNEKLASLLIDLGYIKDYIYADNKLLLPNYNREQINVAKENTELLNNELKLLKKVLIK